MIFLVLGGLALAFFVWMGRRTRSIANPRRLACTIASVGAAGAAVFLGLRGGWMISLVLVAVSVYLGNLARVGAPGAARPFAKPTPPPQAERMSVAEARSILGVGEGASRDDIEAAFRRLMQRAHPDHGGSTGLAAQINAARDRLLR